MVPKSKLAKAINYMNNHWEALTRYLDDGRLEIDNNPVENKPIALGRKNYLFCGSHAAACNSADIYSLMATAKTHDVNPYDWLKDVLGRVMDHPKHQLEQLLPHFWKSSQSEQD